MTGQPPLSNRPPLELHIPQPRARPGEPADFSAIALSAAGAVARPSPAIPASDCRDLAYTLIRVLDDGGHAVGDWNPRLDPDGLRAMLRAMMTTRAFDDRMFRAQRQGKTSFYMKSLGEEAVSVGAAFALDADDMLFPSYRQQGLLVARGWSLEDLMNQLYSNRADRLKGRQLPVMYSVRGANVFSISGNLTTQYPQAVGWAMASAARGDTRIAAAWCGEGSTAEGDFHSACTFAAVYRVPVLLNIVNNQWAISSFSGFAGGDETTFAARGVGYGIAALRVDGNDVLAVHAATRWAAERARASHGPTIIEHVTYRAEGHSTSDDPAGYRPAGDAGAWPLGDPVDRLRRHLVTLGEWDGDRHAALLDDVARTVRTAQRAAEANGVLGHGLHQPLDSLFEDVFADLPWHLRQQRQQLRDEQKAAGL